jgi:hypothetical protein
MLVYAPRRPGTETLGADAAGVHADSAVRELYSILPKFTAFDVGFR